MMKKMMLLAVAAAAVVAFAAPAAASAEQLTWTDNDAHLESGKSASQSFEGFLSFTVAPPVVPVHSTFGCDVTVEIKAEGPIGGKVTKFNPTTETCKGTGVFTGCTLKSDSTNLAEGWNVSVTTEDLTVKHSNAAKDITILNGYEKCVSGATASHLEFPSVTAVPALNGEGTIESLAISGTATTTGAKASGTLLPEGALTLGLAG